MAAGRYYAMRAPARHPEQLGAATIKRILAVWIYLCSLIAPSTTAGILSKVLAAFPPTQVEAHGPRIPAFSRFAAGVLPHVPSALWALMVLSVVAGV